MISHLFIISVILLITSPLSTSAQANCSRICRSRDGSSGNTVPYPFGFTNGCEIPLGCSDDGDIVVGEYNVRNLTRNHIAITFPAKCDRRFRDLTLFNNTNFALTSRNGLLLENCSSALNDCMVSTSIAESHFNLQQCDSSNNRSVNCYSQGNANLEELMDMKKLEATGCEIFFSSVMVELNGSTSQNMPVSLEFQSLELGWWVHGECSCDPNAACQNVSFENQTAGYRCHCNEGYDGDGFISGDGCHGGAIAINSKLKLIIGVGSALSFLLSICTVCCIKKFSLMNCVDSFKNRIEGDVSVETFIKKYGPLTTKRYKYVDVKKMTSSFKVRLGQGGFGTVYKGKLSDGRLVAVKVLKSSKANGQVFINEVTSIAKTSHINIVSLLGFCSNNKKRALIYEFMSNGSLEKFICTDVSQKPSIHIDVRKLYEVILGIARGLDYLHRGCNMRILHLDIKPHNILLDEEFCPKIADFGLAKLYSRKESVVSMLEARGTIGYIAPEVFNKNFGGVSHKSDVYSYGMLILEMVGGRKNVDAGVGSSVYFPY